MKRYTRSPAVVRRWKKFIICGCSHGSLIDDTASQMLLQFRDDYKPDHVIHLGDFMDATAFRSGAHGNKDEAADIDHDVSTGLTFLERLQPTVVFTGNHEDRIWSLQGSPKAKESKLAKDCVSQITRFITKEIRAKFVDHYIITESWMWLGPYKLGHGWMFNESAIRDHADMVGNCVIAHLHRAGVERGRTLGGSTGICVGMIANPKELTYANRNRAKTKWTQSWLHGEVCEDHFMYQHFVVNSNKQVEFERI